MGKASLLSLRSDLIITLTSYSSSCLKLLNPTTTANQMHRREGLSLSGVALVIWPLVQFSPATTSLALAYGFLVRTSFHFYHHKPFHRSVWITEQGGGCRGSYVSKFDAQYLRTAAKQTLIIHNSLNTLIHLTAHHANISSPALSHTHKKAHSHWPAKSVASSLLKRTVQTPSLFQFPWRMAGLLVTSRVWVPEMICSICPLSTKILCLIWNPYM